MFCESPIERHRLASATPVAVVEESRTCHANPVIVRVRMLSYDVIVTVNPQHRVICVVVGLVRYAGDEATVSTLNG